MVLGPLGPLSHPIVNKSVHGAASCYLAEMCIPVAAILGVVSSVLRHMEI